MVTLYYGINVFLYPGVLRNTQPLNYTSSHSHVLSVVATDCGGKKSAPVLVIVEVGRDQMYILLKGGDKVA